MFEATVSPEGNTGTVVLDTAEAPMPFAIHLFGAERVTAWNDANDASRIATANQIVMDLFRLAVLFNLDDREVASLYNRGCALQGIDDHAVEYLGGGIDRVEG